MANPRASVLLKHRDQSGFTLVEVVVAIALIGILSAAAVSFFVSGVASMSEQQRKQGAVSLANSAIDKARSVAPGGVDASGTSGLVKGRSQAAVNASWTAAAALNPDDVADMNPAWDTVGTPSATDQWVPITQAQKIDSQPYTVTTLIGTCYRAKTPSQTSSSCTKAKSASTDITLYRVRVVVSWAENAKATPKTYRLATLVDPSVDPIWNTVLKPFAYDDEVSISAGAPAEFFAIVQNDQVEYDTSGSTSPVVDLTQPAYGTVTVGTGSRINGVMFTPPADKSLTGTVTFKYAVKGSNSEKSSAATVTVHILPAPVDDSFRIQPSTSTVLNDLILANDAGTKNISTSRTVGIVLTSDPTIDMFGTGDVSAETQAARQSSQQTLASLGLSLDGSGNLHFDAPAGDRTDPVIFYYYLVDQPKTGSETPALHSKQAARVSIDVREDEPKSADYDVRIPVKLSNTELKTSLDMQELTDNPENYKIKITSTDIGNGAQGRLVVDGANYNATNNNTGLDIAYVQQGNSPHIATFKYVVLSPGGKVSAEHTIRVLIVPNVQDDSYVVAKNGQKDLEVKLNDAPTDNTVKMASAPTLQPSTCGTLTSDLNNAKVTFKAKNAAVTCTFKYKLVATSFPDLISDEATVTIKVQ